MRQYVFGYGSLICSESRAATAKALCSRADTETGNSKGDDSIPVRLNNWIRLWNVRGHNTYLGVQSLDTDAVSRSNSDSSSDSSSNFQQQPPKKQNLSSRNISCVGVLFALPSSNNDDNDVLEALDRREYAYKRHRVNLGLIERVDDLLIRKEADIDMRYHTSEQNRSGGMDNKPKNQKQEREDKEAIHDKYYKGTFLENRPPPCADEKDASKKDDSKDTQEKNADKFEEEMDEVCVWVYVPLEKYRGMARSESPILQSYVDVCLKGCLSFSKSFAEEFVETSYGWYPGHSHLESDSRDKDKEGISDGESSSPSCWTDDRENPLYGRADKEYSLKHTKVLDSVFDWTILRRRTLSNTKFNTDDSKV